MSVKYRLFDVLALIAGDNGTPNPLLNIIQGHTDPRQANAEKAAQKLSGEDLIALQKTLNDMMIKVVIEPPLVQQGHADGIDVDEFTIEEKMLIFTDLAGGEQQLDAALNFRPLPPGGLVAPLDGAAVRDEAVESAESDGVAAAGLDD